LKKKERFHFNFGAWIDPKTILEHFQKNIIFLWLSHKNDKNGNLLPAFCESTNSGKIIQKIIKKLPDRNIKKLNLVPFTPLDENQKLRYPTSEDMENWRSLLQKQLETISGEIILFLCGKQVSNFIEKKVAAELEKHKNIICKPIAHPSYIAVYKRKTLDGYIEKIIREIQSTTDV